MFLRDLQYPMDGKVVFENLDVDFYEKKYRR